MKLLDYIFRCIGLLIVWCGIGVPAISGGFFIPTDPYDLVLSGMFFSTGVLLTFVIWCGPQMVSLFRGRDTKQTKEANQSIEAIVKTPVESGNVGLHSASSQTLDPNSMKNEIIKELSALIGKPMFDATRAAGMMMFSFGQKIPRINRHGDSIEIGEYAIHLQCPWRILKDDRIVVGIEDMCYPEDLDSEWDKFDLGKSPSFCDKQMQELMNSNEAPILQSVDADVYGGFKLHFESMIVEVFPAHSLQGEYSEHWRLLNNKNDLDHFVITGDGIEK